MKDDIIAATLSSNYTKEVKALLLAGATYNDHDETAEYYSKHKMYKLEYMPCSSMLSIDTRFDTNYAPGLRIELLVSPVEGDRFVKAIIGFKDYMLQFANEFDDVPTDFKGSDMVKLTPVELYKAGVLKLTAEELYDMINFINTTVVGMG